MAEKQRKSNQTQQTDSYQYPLLKTVEQMSRVSGIEKGKRWRLMEQRKIEYVQNGNRRLLSKSALWAWYELNKVPVQESEV